MWGGLVGHVSCGVRPAAAAWLLDEHGVLISGCYSSSTGVRSRSTHRQLRCTTAGWDGMDMRRLAVVVVCTPSIAMVLADRGHEVAG